MESSPNSMRKSLYFFSNDHERMTDETFEESSWTMYFEDFFACNNINGDNNNGSLSSDHHDKGCNSLVSDAASLVVEKSAENEKVAVGLPSGKSHSTLSSKKRKTKEANFDDALEDTASSPANSPKVGYLMNQFNYKIKQKAKMGISQEKGSAGSSPVNERNELGFLGTESDCSEPKKRRLCLSSFVNGSKLSRLVPL